MEVIAPLNAVDGDTDTVLALRLWTALTGHTSYSRSAELYHVERAHLHPKLLETLPRGIFFVGQADDNPPSPFPQKVVFDIHNLEKFGFQLFERQVYPTASCAFWLFEHHDRRGPTLHRFKTYWQRAVLVLENNDSTTLILVIGISKQNHLWVDIIPQYTTDKYVVNDLQQDGTTDRISRSLASGCSVTAVLKKDHSLGIEGYVLDVSLDPQGSLPWPPIQMITDESDRSAHVVGLESKLFNPTQVYVAEKNPTQVSRVLSAMSLGSSKAKIDRKTSFGLPKK